jgi:hypothetical protein
MNEIGLFVSTFGGAGLFILYLINKDKTTSKEQTDAIKKIGTKIDKQTETLDDFNFLFLDLLDRLVPKYGQKRNVAALKSRIEERQFQRNQADQTE